MAKDDIYFYQQIEALRAAIKHSGDPKVYGELWRLAGKSTVEEVKSPKGNGAWASPAVQARLKAMVPDPDKGFSDRFHETCVRHFEGNYEHLVDWMERELADANRREPVRKNKAFFMKRFAMLDESHDWDFFDTGA